MADQPEIKAIIGLGNPGPKYYATRHSIGFRVVDTLANRFGGRWTAKGPMEIAEIRIGDRPVVLVKPQTFMNASGAVMPHLHKRGIEPDQVVVVHDELEIPFGAVKYRFGGSARGHNGLRSIIEKVGQDFGRLRFGIGRPQDPQDVGDYVLTKFDEPDDLVEAHVDQAADMLESLVCPDFGDS